MTDEIKALPPPSDCRQFLSCLKKALENVKSLQDEDIKIDALQRLVSVYLDCPSKIPAKRVIASFFQNLDTTFHGHLESQICQQLQQRLKVDFIPDRSICPTRQAVDCISSLMENFKMGERCLLSMAIIVIKFLVDAEKLFLMQVHEDVPPVRLNEAMHHCHVTVQTLSLVIQKTVVDSTEITQALISDSQLIASILDLDLQIIGNEVFLLDCRCCCAMNAILLLQLSLPAEESAFQIPALIFPSIPLHNSKGKRISWLTDAQAEGLNMNSVSTLSYLSMAFGFIAAINPANIARGDVKENNFYVDQLLPSLLSYGIKCKDTVSKALFGKTVNLWTSKLLTTVKTHQNDNIGVAELHGESPALQSLLTYVWTYWDDQLDVIRQSAKTVFENVLKLHCFVSKDAAVKDSFVQSVLHHLFSVSWTSRGKFSALTSCVQLVGTQIMLTRRPSLPVEVLQQLQEQAISCYASELYSSLFTSHHQELLSKSEQVEEWKNLLLKTWLEPVIHALCSSNKKLKQNIIEYLLPKLLKSDEQILNYMIQRLSSPDADQCDPCYGAIIMCLRRARVLGLLKSTTMVDDTDSRNFLWFGYLQPDILKAALCSCDEQIRLDAFALLCDNCKTTEVVTVFEFSMLKFFIPYNLNSQSPAFRQAFTALLKKLFFRVKESMGALQRQAKKEKLQESACKRNLKHYEDFLTFLTDHLLCSLYPGSAFARRTTSLAVLSLMSTYFTTSKDGFAVHEKLPQHHIWTLLECLTDTFEENKKEALKLLNYYLAHGGPIWDKVGMEDMLRISVSLACSTRPQDGPTAVYNLLLILKQQEIYPSLCGLSEVIPRDLLPSFLVIPETTNGYLCLLSILLALLDDQINVANQSLITAASNRPMYPTLHCIRYILHELNFKSLSQDEILVAREFIQHLTNSCLNLSEVVSPVVQNSSPEGHVPEDAILGPGLNNALQPDSQGEQTTTSLSESVVLSRALVEAIPEYLVVCCWRSIKEVSLTLGKICLQLPVSLISDSKTALLSLEQVKVIGEYFTQQLLESIHRGAFELAYAGFQLMCQMLWNHPSATFRRLPGQWLAAVMTDIRSNDPESRLCATRRSAGVPFFVQAITSSEPMSTGRKCFHSVMKELLELAITQQNTEQRNKENNSAQVHALNILRALYRDARLGEDVVPYVADGLKSAILGFKSELWAVRNSATLLLSALMTRMFGVKRSKDETAMSKKNCQTGRAFFFRYPSLYPFLLAELKEATADIGSRDKIHLHPSLYPVLLVLGRLFPSTLEGSDTSLSLSAFIPYVVRCASSPVYKTRIIASRAIQPLARRNEVISISQQLFANLPESSSCQDISSSHIHGSLLQLCQLMGLVSGFSINMQRDVLDSVLPHTLNQKWLISRENPCFATRQQALLLFDTILGIAENFSRSSQVEMKIAEELQHIFFISLIEGAVPAKCIWQPLYFDFEKTRAKLCLKHLAEIGNYMANKKSSSLKRSAAEKNGIIHLSCELAEKNATTHSDIRNTKSVSGKNDMKVEECMSDIVLGLLRSPTYEVRLGVLDMLHRSCCQGEGEFNTEDGKNTELSEEIDQEHDMKESEVHDMRIKSSRFQSDVRISGGGSGIVTKIQTSDLCDQLFHMALDQETHHECLEKVFSVLALLPACPSYLGGKDITEIREMLQVLLVKMSKERRVEVRAAILRFSGFLLPLVYDNITSTNESAGNDPSLQSLTTWIDLLKSSSHGNENPELQISGCQVLFENTRMLLQDTSDRLGEIKYLCWDSLANLLQEDDLEVKDLAASVLCVVQGLKPGSYHPSYALHCLPTALVSIHGESDICGVLTCLLKWILNDEDMDVQESSDRLFDKGEMNTYWDQTAFSRSVAMTLTAFFGIDLKGQHSILLNSSGDRIKHIVAEISHISSSLNPHMIMTDDKFCAFLKDAIFSLSHELNKMLPNCQKTDSYFSNGQYLIMCQTILKARIFLLLFHREEFQDSLNSFHQHCQDLNGLVSTVIRDLNLGNTVTAEI